MSSGGKQRIESLIHKIQFIQSKMNDDLERDKKDLDEAIFSDDESVKNQQEVQHGEEVDLGEKELLKQRKEEKILDMPSETSLQDLAQSNKTTTSSSAIMKAKTDSHEEMNEIKEMQSNAFKNNLEDNDDLSSINHDNQSNFSEEYHDDSESRNSEDEEFPTTNTRATPAKSTLPQPMSGLKKLRQTYLSASEVVEESGDDSSVTSNELARVTQSIQESIESLRKSNKTFSLFPSPQVSSWEFEDNVQLREYNEEEHGLKLGLDFEGLNVKTSYATNKNRSNSMSNFSNSRPRRSSFVSNTTNLGTNNYNCDIKFGQSNARKRPASASLKHRPKVDSSSFVQPKESKGLNSSRQLHASTDFETGLSVARSQMRSINSQLAIVKSQYNEEIKKTQRLENELKEVTMKYNKSFSDVLKYKHKCEADRSRYEKQISELKKELEGKKETTVPVPEAAKEIRHALAKENDELKLQIKKMRFRLEKQNEELERYHSRRLQARVDKLKDMEEIQDMDTNEEFEDEVRTQSSYMDEIDLQSEASKLKRQLREVKSKYDKDMNTIKAYLEEIRVKNIEDIKAIQESKAEEVDRLHKMLNQYKTQQRKDVDSVFKERVKKLENQKDILVKENEQQKATIERLEATLHEKTQTLKRILTESLMLKSQVAKLETEKDNLRNENSSLSESITSAEKLVDQLKEQFEEQRDSLDKRLKAEHEKYIQGLRATHDTELSQLRSTYESSLEAFKLESQKVLDIQKEKKRVLRDEIAEVRTQLKLETMQKEQLKNDYETTLASVDNLNSELNELRKTIHEKEVALMHQESKNAHLHTLNSQLLRQTSMTNTGQSGDISTGESVNDKKELAATKDVTNSVSKEETSSVSRSIRSSRSTKTDKTDKSEKSPHKRSTRKSSRSNHAPTVYKMEKEPSKGNTKDSSNVERRRKSSKNDLAMNASTHKVKISDIKQLLSEDDYGEELDEDILKGIDDGFGDEEDYLNADLDAHINSILSSHNV